MGFIEDIPKDLEEAAWIDGASKTQAFLRIVLPLSTPGMVATAILCFIFSWNNFQLALVLGGFDVSTAPVSVFKYADPEAGGSGQMMAAATLVTLPVFFIVLLIQKQLTAGLTIGGSSSSRGSRSARALFQYPSFEGVGVHVVPVVGDAESGPGRHRNAAVRFDRVELVRVAAGVDGERPRVSDPRMHQVDLVVVARAKARHEVAHRGTEGVHLDVEPEGLGRRGPPSSFR